MSLMGRRLQLLLDQERHELVAGEARRSGRSVAAVIREAIDVHFADPGAHAKRAAAGERFLALTATVSEQKGQSWKDITRQLAEDFEQHVTKKAGT